MGKKTWPVLLELHSLPPPPPHIVWLKVMAVAEVSGVDCHF